MEVSMTSVNAEVSQSQARDFRTFTASTKVTEAELASLEKAAAECDMRLGEWIRDLLLREARLSSSRMATEQIMTEIVGLQLFLTNVLSSVVRGQQMSAEQYQELMRNVKANKRRTAREAIAQYAAEVKEERHA
jgi:predicted negative regulator of RcsB-dependent stress response